jgi:hypothetical protein
MSETLALFVRYSLLVTAPIQESERQAAEALGRKRYEVFIREVAKRVTSDKGMIADVIRTMVRTHPHLVAEAMAEARREIAVGGMSLCLRDAIRGWQQSRPRRLASSCLLLGSA